MNENQEGIDEEMEKLKKTLHEERIKKVEAINKLAEVSVLMRRCPIGRSISLLLI